jgi:GNAT superfamily N-acetyltransferase
MKVEVAIARSRGEILRCQYMIAEVYSREYGVVFDDDRYDLDAKIEPWPHRYLVCRVDGRHVATFGLYLRDTYVQRYGRVEDHEIDGLIALAGAQDRFAAALKREVTKLVVDPAFRGTGLGRFVLGAGHARAFLQTEAERDHVLVSCAKRTIWENLYDRLGIKTRIIKPFPLYRVHELYRSESDPMDSRLIIPDLDVPPRWYALDIPGKYEIDRTGELR